MSKLLFGNNAIATLASPITSVDTTVTLASGTGSLFPQPTGGQYFVATFEDISTGNLQEIVWVTNITGDVATIVRAQEGTTALNWVSGDVFANLWTAGQMAVMLQQGDAQSQSSNYAPDTGTANAYYCTLTPALASPVVGMPIRVKIGAGNTSTGASTFNPGSGVAAVKHPDGSDIGAGDIPAGGLCTFEWDGTNYQLTSQVWPINTNGLANSAVTTAKIAANAVTTATIADSNVTTSKIAANAVTTATIADNNVTTSKIATSAVTNTLLANVSTGTIKGRSSAGTGSVQDLNGTQATALLDNVVGDSGAGGTKGLVPAPGAGAAALGYVLLASGIFGQADLGLQGLIINSTATGYWVKIGQMVINMGIANSVAAGTKVAVTLPRSVSAVVWYNAGIKRDIFDNTLNSCGEVVGNETNTTTITVANKNILNNPSSDVTWWLVGTA